MGFEREAGKYGFGVDRPEVVGTVANDVNEL